MTNTTAISQIESLHTSRLWNDTIELINKQKIQSPHLLFIKSDSLYNLALSEQREVKTVLLGGNYRTPPTVHRFRKYSKKSRDCFKQASIFLDTVIKTDPSAKAFHLRGKVFKKLDKISKAYDNYIEAAKLDSQYKNACYKMFSQYMTLPFQEIENFQDLTLSDVANGLDSEHPFLRLQSCHYITNLTKKNSDEKIDTLVTKIEKLAGLQICSIYLPITGDYDERVRSAARNALLNLQYL